MIGTKKADQVQEKQTKILSGKAGAVFTNSLGILFAFGIAFGGLFLVHHRLVREENALLNGGGRVEVLVQSEALPARDAGEEEVMPAALTESQLYRVVEKLAEESGTVPHEPWDNQLSLAEAAACGREWVENFLLPNMGINDYKLTEYSVNCSLWAWRTDVEAGATDPEYSYWTVCMDAGDDLAVRLILNAVTGQVLWAYTSSSLLVEYQEEDKIEGLLYAYAGSFGMEEKYILYVDGEENELWALSRNGSTGIHASVKTSNVAIASAERGYAQAEPMELFTVELKLETD